MPYVARVKAVVTQISYNSQHFGIDLVWAFVKAPLLYSKIESTVLLKALNFNVFDDWKSLSKTSFRR